MGQRGGLAEPRSSYPRLSHEAKACRLAEPDFSQALRAAQDGLAERDQHCRKLAAALAGGEDNLAGQRQRQRSPRVPIMGPCVRLCAGTSALGLVQSIKFHILGFLINLWQCKPSWHGGL